MIVLDANILIRAVLGLRVKVLLEEYAKQGVRFHTPETAFAEALCYLPSLLARRKQSLIDPTAALAYVRQFVAPAEVFFQALPASR